MIPALSVVGSLFGTSPLAQAGPAQGPELKTAAAPGSIFANVLDQVGEAVGNLKTGEAAALSGLQGQTSVQNVVEAVMTAERSLQTSIAIRDKLVAAYQSISQMAI